MLRFKLLLFLCLNLFTFMVYGQQPQFKQLTTEQGLSSNTTYFTHQDSVGFIWVCSNSGLARFDGHHFKNFTTRNGLPSNGIFHIVETYSPHRLWISSYGNSLCYYDYSADSIIKHSASDKIKEIIAPKTRAIFQLRTNKAGSVWINFPRNKSVYYITRKSDTLQSVIQGDGLNKKHGIHLFSSDDDHISFLNLGYTPDTPLPSYLVTNQKSSKIERHESIGNDLRSVIRNRNLIIQQYGQNILYSTKSSNLKESSSLQLKVRIHGVQLSNSGDLLVSTAKGLYRFPNANINRSPQIILPQFEFSSAREGKNGKLWCTTLANGLIIIPNKFSRVHPTKEQIISTKKFKNSILFGTRKSNILEKKAGQNVIHKIALPIDVFEQRSFVQQGEKMIFNANSGLFELNLENNNTQQLSKKSGRILKVLNPSTLVTSDINGLYTINRKTYKFNKIYKGSIDQVTTKNNTLLFAVNGIIYQYNEGKIDTVLNQKNKIISFKPWRKGLILTYSNGSLNYWDFKRKSTSEINIPSPIKFYKYSIEKDTLWGINKTKIHKVVLGNNAKVIGIESFNQENGFSTSEINRFTTTSTELITITSKDITFIPKKSLNHVEPSLSVNILKTLIDSFPPLSNYLKIDFDQSLQLNYSAFAFPINGEVIYRYRLNKDRWVETKENQLSFSSLSAGFYELEIQCKAYSDLWSKSTVIPFSFHPPFWKTIWAIGCYLIIGGLLVFFFFKRRIRQLKRKQADFKKRIELEQMALRSQMNPHFIFNSLSSIQYSILKDDKVKANLLTSRFTALTRLTLEHSRKEMVDLEEEIELLTSYLEIESSRAKNVNFELSCSIDFEEQSVLIPPMMVQPFIENSFKHAFVGIDYPGNISIEIKMTNEDSIEFSVSDNGIGMTTQSENSHPKKHKSMALQIIRERFDLLQKAYGNQYGFEYVNGNEKGTSVIISLPAELEF